MTRLRGIPYPTAQTPAADDVAPFHLSAGKCSALILSPLRDRTKAWHMWGDGSGQAGANPWARVSGGAHMCWGSTRAQAAAFFDQVASTGQSGIARRKGHTGGGSVAAWGEAALLASALTPPPHLWPQVASGTGCAANWFAGAPGGLGDPSAPPQWGLPGAPALLGFDRDVLAACHALHGVTAEKASAVGTADFDAALALGCFAARQHVLRVSAELEPRTACQMLEWTTCAARGLLPGQDGRRIRFAVAPSELDTRAWIRPGEECVAGSCGVREANFAASDLHFVQARRLSPP